METDLFGEEMSSTRQGTDERNSREGRQKQTKACTQIHSCRKWNRKKKEDPPFSQCASLERSSTLTVTWSDVWKVLHPLSDG